MRRSWAIKSDSMITPGVPLGDGIMTVRVKGVYLVYQGYRGSSFARLGMGGSDYKGAEP